MYHEFINIPYLRIKRKGEKDYGKDNEHYEHGSREVSDD